MQYPILTLWGHGQSKSLFLLPRHSHVMRKPTKKKQRKEQQPDAEGDVDWESGKWSRNKVQPTGNGHRAVLRRHHGTIEGQGRRTTGTHRVVCCEDFRSAGRDRRREPS